MDPTRQQINYGSTVLDIILNTFKNSTYGSQFSNFLYGNPEEEIDASQCPMIIGIKEQTDIQQETTAHDRVSYTLLVRVVINKYKISESFSGSEVMTFRELENMIEGLDPITGLYDPSSIVSLLRVNFTQQGYLVDQKMHVKYGKVINPLVDEITREAQISINCDKLVLVPSRT